MTSFLTRSLVDDETAQDPARLVTRIAIQRGASSVSDVRAFLSPEPPLQCPWEGHYPLLDAAADRIRRAITLHERVVVFGDYDVDGITSLVQLVRFLNTAGASTSWFVPHRADEGYGLTDRAAARCCVELNPRLIITVDCGSNSAATIAQLQARGIDVIVIDHHQACHGLPGSIVHLNPHTIDGTSPELRRMSAAGLTYFLCRYWSTSMGVSISRSENVAMLTLAGLGTLVDVMPLVGTNRALVKHSLMLASSPTLLNTLPGIAALLRDHPTVTAWTYAFHLGPILNAAGRILTAENSIELLLTTNRTTAERMATDALQVNAARRSEQDAALREAYEDCESILAASPDLRAIVVGRRSWHPGVVGIIASKIRERFHRPAFVCGGTGQCLKGSGRSIAAYDLGAAVVRATQAGMLSAGGGHAMAAGIEIIPEQMATFQAFLHGECSLLPADAFLPVYETLPASGRLADHDWMDLMTLLEPFGAGNQKPLVHVRRARLVAPPRVLMPDREHAEGSRDPVELTFTDTTTNRLFRCCSYLPFDRLPAWNAGVPAAFSALLSVNVTSRSRGRRSTTPWTLKAVSPFE